MKKVLTIISILMISLVGIDNVKAEPMPGFEYTKYTTTSSCIGGGFIWENGKCNLGCSSFGDDECNEHSVYCYWDNNSCKYQTPSNLGCTQYNNESDCNEQKYSDYSYCYWSSTSNECKTVSTCSNHTLENKCITDSNCFWNSDINACTEKTSYTKPDSSQNSGYQTVTCGYDVQLPAALPVLVYNLINIVKVIVPIILIILGMLDLGKAMASQDEKSMNDSKKKIIRRAISGMIIFFVPTIVQFIFGMIGTDTTNELISCVDCFINKNCDKMYLTVEKSCKVNGENKCADILGIDISSSQQTQNNSNYLNCAGTVKKVCETKYGSSCVNNCGNAKTLDEYYSCILECSDIDEANDNSCYICLYSKKTVWANSLTGPTESCPDTWKKITLYNANKSEAACKNYGNESLCKSNASKACYNATGSSSSQGFIGCIEKLETYCSNTKNNSELEGCMIHKDLEGLYKCLRLD